MKAGATLEIAQPGVSEPPAAARVLTPAAPTFVADLHQQFESRRRALWQMRDEHKLTLRSEMLPGFLQETMHVRKETGRVAAVPNGLNDRRAQSAGPEFVPFLSLSDYHQLD